MWGAKLSLILGVLIAMIGTLYLPLREAWVTWVITCLIMAIAFALIEIGE